MNRTTTCKLNWAIVLACVGAWLGLASFAEHCHAGDSPALSESQVKASFLLKFAKYVDWPDEAFAATNAPIVIGVLGQINFDGELKKAVEGKSVEGREIVVRTLGRNDAPDGCHILFISGPEQRRMGRILGRTAGKPVLTVGDTDQFTKQGGMIDFAVEEGKVRLEINLAPAKKAGLLISSKLLSVADAVRGKP